MKKLLAIVLVASFAFVGAINASAVTIEELQAQIATLLQQIAALSGTTTTTPATTTCFSTDLQQGMTSNDVKLLQEKLGVINTGYFGPLTLSAVKTFQGQNSIPTTGYVGPMTRAALNAKYCVTTPVTTVPTTTVTTAPVAGATEGTLSAVTSPTFVETTIKKGDLQKSILAAKLEAKNSDINVQRIDVTLTGTSIQPWKTYSTFELYVNGTLIKGIPALKENFLENTFGASYTLRFDNISFNVAKSGNADVVLKASVLPNPENVNNTKFEFAENAFRGRDGKGLDQYAVTNAQDTADTFQTGNLAPAAASTGTLTFSLNVNTPKTSYILGNKTATSADKEIAKFDVKAENRDVTIKTLKVTMTDSDADKLVSAVKLYDGSTLLASVAGPGNGKDATFTNLSILIAKDTTKTLTVKVDLKPIDGTTIVEGGTTSATITPNATQITAVDSNDDMLANDHINAGVATAVTGKTVKAWTIAPTIALVSTNIVKTTQAGAKDVADTTIVFNVSANNGDIYIKKYFDAEEWITVTGPADGGWTYTSTADAVNVNTDTVKGEDYWLVRNGETKSFTITGRIEGADAFAKMALSHIYWMAATPTDAADEIAQANDLSATVYDLSTFETTSVYLNDPTN